ncbi:restriction endonuclease subunit S [uncultured Actinomyces sp.]|uniref:restriction endonuclease subunit S n=1 Tax=uncultured Actinomyces sp. TaxID=249061 RepID=UPI0028D6441A|nr:restriction endonuclease subunit S [uncultured Actinomyces sp.]
MSRLAELIAELCPDGVEYRAIGEMGSLFGGLSGKTKSDFTEVDGACPFVTYKEVYSLLEINQIPQGRVLVSSREKQLVLQRGDVLFTGSSENADEVGLTAVVTVGFSEPVYLNSFSICLRWYEHAFEPGYTKYLFASPSVRAQIRRCANGVTRFNLSKKRLEGVRVPVPPLEVQREIVRILDQFTTLEAELEAELEARRVQYEYYRNHLLSYDSLAARGLVSWIPLRELGVWSGGGTPSKSRADYWDEGNIPWITPKDMRSSKIQNSMMNVTDRAVRESNVKLIEAPSIALVVRSSILQHTFPVAQIDVDATFNQDMKALVVDSDRFERRYIYYALSANGQEILRQTSKQGGSVNSLVVPRLMDFEIPVPALDEQQRIADLLDRFDALVNDISSGLPAEIAARRAQYEHYRDRLLSFPEKKAE